MLAARTTKSAYEITEECLRKTGAMTPVIQRRPWFSGRVRSMQPSGPPVPVVLSKVPASWNASCTKPARKSVHAKLLGVHEVR